MSWGHCAELVWERSRGQALGVLRRVGGPQPDSQGRVPGEGDHCLGLDGHFRQGDADVRREVLGRQKH